MIYVIEAVGLNAVKFGKAKNPEYRLKVLQTGSAYPLKLLAAVDWHDDKERMIHKAFAPARLRGEWFEASYDVEEFVNTIMCPNATEDRKFEVCMGILADIFKRPKPGQQSKPERVKNGCSPRAEYMKAYMRAYRKGRAWPKRDRAEYMRQYRARI